MPILGLYTRRQQAIESVQNKDQYFTKQKQRNQTVRSLSRSSPHTFHLAESTVDDEEDTVYSQRRLGNVGGHNTLPHAAIRLLEDLRLIESEENERESQRQEWQHDGKDTEQNNQIIVGS
jgi:hypothetical protein